MRLDRFRMYPAEARVARAANFIAGDAIAPEKFDEQARGRAMHDIGDEAKLRVPQPFPIDQFFECVEIWRARLQNVNHVFSRRGRRGALSLLPRREFFSFPHTPKTR